MTLSTMGEMNIYIIIKKIQKKNKKIWILSKNCGC